MSNLFTRPHSGWRYEPQLPREGVRKLVEALELRLQMLEQLEPHANDVIERQRKAIGMLTSNQHKQLEKYKSKRRGQRLRRSNPRSLGHVLAMMKALCLETARTRQLDTGKSYWFLKAEMASKLQVPEHFISQALHKWNLAGICNQGENVGVHDTHRGGFWGGPWVSSWQDTRYTINLSKLHKFGTEGHSG